MTVTEPGPLRLREGALPPFRKALGLAAFARVVGITYAVADAL